MVLASRPIYEYKQAAKYCYNLLGVITMHPFN